MTETNRGMPIRVLSERTGVAATTLRAWEKRYGLLKPARTPKGHRFYTEEDVRLVGTVVALLQQGSSISEAVRQLKMGEIGSSDTAEAVLPDQWGPLRQRLLHAVEGFNEAQLEQVYNEALSIYPFDLVTENLIWPVMESLGERWSQREAGIGEEHFFSAYLRNKLGARLHHESSRTQGKRLLVACLPGEYHELGALLFSLAALARGYRVLYLGASFPFAQLNPVVKKSKATAIILSGSSRQFDAEIEHDWQQAAPFSVPVYFGGQFAVDNASWITSQGAEALGEEPAEALQWLMHHNSPYSAL